MADHVTIKLDIGFANFELFDDYLIATVQEGIVLQAKEMNKFHEVFKNHYSNRPFGYISNRKFDYTVDPTYYKEVENYDFNLVGIATLCYSPATYDTAKFAEKFFKWPHQAFFTLEECVAWIAKLVAKEKKADL